MTLTNMTISYRANVLFKNIDYQFEPSCYIISGPNGSGKSSLLRVIAGIEKPTDGDVKINNQWISNNPDNAKRLIGYCPDQPQIYPFIKPRDFINWVRGIYNVSDSSLTDELIHSFDVHSYLNQPFRNLSLGTAKKFFLIASLLHDAPLLVFDEPTNAIDKSSVEYLIDFLATYKKGSTLIMATHDIHLMNSLECKIIKLSHEICTTFRNTKATF